MTNHLIDEQSTALVFSRAQKWLASLEKTSSCFDVSLKILLGQWICDRVQNRSEPSPFLNAAIEAIKFKLLVISRSNLFDARQHDSQLLLLCRHILRGSNVHSFCLDNFADALGKALCSLPQIPLRFLSEAFLLQRSGLALTVPFETSLPASLASEYDLIMSSKLQLREIGTYFSAATRYGTQDFPYTVLPWWEKLLPGILIDSLRQYDLAPAAILLKTLCYLKVDSWNRELSNADLFIAEQQQESGSFGRFAPEILELERIRGKPYSSVVELDLPTTLSCIWALAEHRVPEFSIV